MKKSALWSIKWVALKRAFVFQKQIRMGLFGFAGFLGLLGQQHSLDVGQHAALSDGHSAHEFVQLLVVAHRQLQVTGDDTGLLVVPSGVSSQLQDLSRQILEHSCQINRSTSTDSAGRSYLCGEACEHDRRGTAAQLWRNESSPSLLSYHRFYLEFFLQWDQLTSQCSTLFIISVQTLIPHMCSQTYRLT